MKILTLLLLIFNLLHDSVLANLKSCTNETEQLKICFTGKNGYVNPFPVNVDTFLLVREVNEINVDKNFISIHAYLMTQWKDPGISTPNDSM